MPTDRRQPCLMLEQDSQEHATKRPGNATWQSSFVACIVIVIDSSPRYFTSIYFGSIKASSFRTFLCIVLHGRDGYGEELTAQDVAIQTSKPSQAYARMLPRSLIFSSYAEAARQSI